MKMMQKLMLLLLITLFAACSKSEVKAEYKGIKLPLTSDNETIFLYGSPKNSYLRIRENPDPKSKPVAMLWYGNIFEIFTRIDDSWYKIHFSGYEGWVSGSEIILYEDLQSAKKCVKLTHE